MRRLLLTLPVLAGMLMLTGCAAKRPLLSPAQPPVPLASAARGGADQGAAGSLATAQPASYQQASGNSATGAPQYTDKELRRMRVRSAASYGASTNPGSCFT
ncbi:MAG: hypothetical protein J5I93_17430 [Pirellulaceae bacterium]|nr:hypothetical protein [Pirellulaceae bacterium]